MRRTSIHLFVFFLILLAPLSGCDESQQQAVETVVTYMPVKAVKVSLETELPGRVSAYFVSEVRPQVGGIILERLFEEGSYITKGQVLYQIDPALFQAEVNNAKATLAKAEAAANASRLLAARYGKLVKSQAVSRQENDDAKAEHQASQATVLSAKAALDTALINLQYAQVIAPISGRIGRSSVTAGALVSPGQSVPLATIQMLDSVYVDVTQSSTDATAMRAAMGGSVTNDILLKLSTGHLYKHFGTLQFYDVTVDPTTDMVNVRISFPNPEGELLPGMYVRGIIQEKERDAFMLPQKVVQYDAKGAPFVKVLSPVTGEKAAGQEAKYTISPRPVVLAKAIDNQWIITDGLKIGDLILVNGQVRDPNQVVIGKLVAEDSTDASTSKQPSQAQEQ